MCSSDLQQANKWLLRQKRKSKDRFRVITAKERMEKKGKALLESSRMRTGTRARQRNVGKGVLKGLNEHGDESAQEALKIYRDRKKSGSY